MIQKKITNQSSFYQLISHYLASRISSKRSSVNIRKAKEEG